MEATLDDQLKTLDNVLQKLKKITPTVEPKDSGENYHFFGPINLYAEKLTVEETINLMKKSHEVFTTINNPTTLMKHVTEKYALNSINQPLTECLHTIKSKMRKLINGNTLKSTMQKLEAMSTEEGLRFDRAQMESNCFISSDMFYIEVSLDPSGMAEDVKLHGHSGEANKSCKELINILRKRDFDEFHAHLKGLKERSSLKGTAATKSKILNSLEILEEDVMKIMNSNVSSNMVSEVILSGPVGYVIPRVGGKDLQMTFCADPLQLLDTRQSGMNKVFSSEDPLPRDFGYSVCLSVQQSETTLLPVTSMVSVDNNMLHFSQFDGTNSEELPGNFVLYFRSPLPASIFTVKYLYKMLSKDSSSFSHKSTAPLDDLIFTKSLRMKGDEWKDRDFPVVLPDEFHLYRCIPSEDEENYGLLLANIPFSHPMQLPNIIKILRCQAIYNTLLCSCFNAKNIPEKDENRQKLVFNVKASEDNLITVTFIHPLDDSIASVDFTVSAEAVIECCLNVVRGSPVVCTNEYLNKVANKCMSLPIVMRSIMRKSKSYRPEQEPFLRTSTNYKKPFQKPLKLEMPTLAQIQSNHLLMSPQLSTASPSSFLNFSGTGMSSNTPIFPQTAASSDGTHKNRNRKPSTTGTPNSDGSRTPNKLKLPKLLLKRKRNEASDIYEIDKTKSDIESTYDTNTMESGDNIDSLAFVYSQFDNDVPMKPLHGMFSDSEPFPGLTGLEGDSDISKLLGIPQEPFEQSDSGPSGIAQEQAFDIDAIRGGNDMNFDTVPGNAMDPSSLVNTSVPFGLDPEMIDIDSFM